MKPRHGFAFSAGVVVAVLAAIAISAVVRGAVLAALWGWFVVPLGVRDIGIVEAMGISLLVGFLAMQAQRDERPAGERILLAFSTSIGGEVAFVLAFGFVLQALL